MMSKTYEQAEKFYEEHKDEIYKKLAVNFEIDNQREYHQVAVWFKDFSICYQDSDMNGGGVGEAHAFNSGADSVIEEMGRVINNDDFMSGLVASDEYHEDYFVDEFIYYFCDRFADEHDIVGILEKNYEDEDEDDDYDEEE